MFVLEPYRAYFVIFLVYLYQFYYIHAKYLLDWVLVTFSCSQNRNSFVFMLIPAHGNQELPEVHCKLTSQIQLTLLLRLCDSVAPLVLILRTSVRKANLFGYISRLKNIFVLFNSPSIRGVMIKNI